MADNRYSFLCGHRGMLQTDRLASAPSGNTMKVSDRRFEDFVKHTAEFARSLHFYGDDNRIHGDWTVFFSQIYRDGRVLTDVIEEMVRTSSVPPHLALLFAFFQMLLIEQEDLNNLTDRQMEFYFRDILGFDIEKGTEGAVTVFAELAKNTPCVSIPKGVLFDAGKDAAGASVTYENVDELRLGREEVAFFSRYDDQSGFDTVGKDAPENKHALCVSSRLFGLTGGSLKVTIGRDISIYDILKSIDPDLVVEYTSVEGWASIEDTGDGLVISADMAPMVSYDSIVHGEGLNTPYPVIRFVSDKGMGAFTGISPFWCEDVRVTQEDGEPLRIENKYGLVENRSGVNPFGYECRKGDWFRVILPFPASDLDVSVEMNKMVYKRVKEVSLSPDGIDREKYEIANNDCDQELISKDYSVKLLTVMKKASVEEDEIKKALEGSLMAVLPRLVAPVTIRKASFSDHSAAVFFKSPCGAHDMTGRHFINDDFRLQDFATSHPDKVSDPSALYIAFAHADLDRGQLSLYFKMSDRVKDPGRVAWYHISDGKWEKFIESRILRDTTCGLSQDGTVVLDYQDRLQSGGCGYLSQYAWIKAECGNGNCKEVLDIRSRAIELSYNPTSGGTGPSGSALPAGTISKTTSSITGLKKVSQPYDGLSGEKAEAQPLFRRRVAETLRHKGRAWTAWDYESLVLGAFPEISYAKCLSSCDGEGNVCPGSVTVLVIPEVCDDKLMPSCSVRLINKVREELQQVCTPFVDIHVVNPSYRRIKVKTTVALRKGYNDPVRYEALMSTALQDYLQPWKGYGDGKHIREGEGISDIIAFLESLPYVDVIEDMDVFIDDELLEEGWSIEFGTPLEIITSALEHEVRCHTAN